jgi:hypothetical protein
MECGRSPDVRNAWKADVSSSAIFKPELHVSVISDVLLSCRLGRDEMASKLPIVLLATFAFGTSIQATAAGPIRFIGTTTARGELRNDVVQLIVPFGGADCPMPSEVRTGILNSSMISPNASYYSPALGTTYERWDARFCGKVERFLIKFLPDPQGGTFLSLEYPYPADAPSGF